MIIARHECLIADRSLQAAAACQAGPDTWLSAKLPTSPRANTWPGQRCNVSAVGGVLHSRMPLASALLSHAARAPKVCGHASTSCASAPAAAGCKPPHAPAPETCARVCGPRRPCRPARTAQVPRGGRALQLRVAHAAAAAGAGAGFRDGVRVQRGRRRHRRRPRGRAALRVVAQVLRPPARICGGWGLRCTQV